MAGGCLHREDRTSGILDKLIQNSLLIVKITIFETGKGTYSDDVTITTHHRNRFQQMFRFVTIHDDTTFCFQFPCTLVDVQHHHIHSQIESSFLCAEAGAEAGVKEDHHQCLVSSQLYIFEAVFLNFKCFCKG